MTLSRDTEVNETSISDYDFMEVTTTLNTDTDEGKHGAGMEDVNRSSDVKSHFHKLKWDETNGLIANIN